ncbi:MAG: hypothetical protein IKC48_03625 [Clostridia bacterium]|nr:hypothetical protein [Clostridia bacterium]
MNSGNIDNVDTVSNGSFSEKLKSFCGASLKVIIIGVLLTIASIAIIGFAIIFLINWAFVGIRFTPEAAIGQSASNMEYIKVKDCYFYYETIDDYYSLTTGSHMGDGIYSVTPVTKTWIIMWYVPSDVYAYPVVIDGTETVIGGFYSFEVSGTYHNFFVPKISRDKPLSLPEPLAQGYSAVTVNGEQVELFKHSYFTTEAKVEEFDINGTKLKITKDSLYFN